MEILLYLKQSWQIFLKGQRVNVWGLWDTGTLTSALSIVFNFHAVTQQQFRQYIHEYGVCSNEILIPKQEANSQTIVCRPYPAKSIIYDDAILGIYSSSPFTP